VGWYAQNKSTYYTHHVQKQHGEDFCCIAELTNAIPVRPGFNLLRDISLSKTAGAKGSSKMTFGLNNDEPNDNSGTYSPEL